MIFFLPTVVNHDFNVEDPSDIDIKVTGILAESLIDTTFMSLPLGDAMIDFCTVISEIDNSIIPAGPSLSIERFASDDSTSLKKKTLTDLPVSTIHVPLVILKIKGSTVFLGSIKDDSIVK